MCWFWQFLLLVQGDGFQPNSAELKTAVKDWFTDRTTALTKYGNISDWDTSEVTDMTYLFCSNYGQCPDHNVPSAEFSEDLSRWNTSKVTSMNSMFRRANFNADLSQWDTS